MKCLARILDLLSARNEAGHILDENEYSGK